MKLDKKIQDGLRAPFPEGEIKWLPKITTKKQGQGRVPIERNGQRVAGCMAHIDARQVMDRLDAVVGSGNWSDSYAPSAIGRGVECTLTVMGVSKVDVGIPSDQDPEKGAYSDALKRAAVKFGIGRHLYDIAIQWLPFDGYKITSKPTKKAEPLPSHSIADLRATIEGAKDDGTGKVTLGFVCNRATATGHYRSTGDGQTTNADKHAFNAAMSWPGWPEENGKFSKMTLKMSSLMPIDNALELFDWLVERKQEAE